MNEKKRAVLFYLKESTLEKLRVHIEKNYGNRSFFVEKALLREIEKDNKNER